jgi:hypothetical protein
MSRDIVDTSAPSDRLVVAVGGDGAVGIDLVLADAEVGLR